jgi:transposase
MNETKKISGDKYGEENEIKSVAMESTGTYWQSLHAVLIADGFQVILWPFFVNFEDEKTSFWRRIV